MLGVFNGISKMGLFYTEGVFALFFLRRLLLLFVSVLLYFTFFFFSGMSTLVALFYTGLFFIIINQWD